MLFKTPKYRVVEIKKETQARMFRNLDIGDEMIFVIKYSVAGAGVPFIECNNLTKNESVSIYFNDLKNRLKNFEIEKLDE